MNRNFHRTTAAIALFATFAFAPALLAQPGKGRGMQRYDKSKAVVLTGTIDEVKTMESPMGFEGIHLMLSAGGATVDVHLGPSSFLKEKGFEPAKGDTIEVTGARVEIGGVDSLLARQVKKGDQTLVLRDENGVPLWSRGRGMRKRS